MRVVRRHCQNASRRLRLTPTLQPLQDPIVLLPWVCFRGAAFLTLPVCRGHTAVELKGWTGSVRVQGGFYVTAPSAEAVEVE
jgi:hypothetical protein